MSSFCSMEQKILLDKLVIRQYIGVQEYVRNL
jgi:hypothetical protein